MVHNEHLRKADELYEVWHDNNGRAIHMYIKDGEAIIFPSLDSLVRYVYFGEETDRLYMEEGKLMDMPEEIRYNFYLLKDRMNKSLFEDTFVTALEGGSNYWAYIKDDTIRKIRKEGVPMAEYVLQAVLDGIDIDVYDVESDDDEPIGTISIKTMNDRIEKLRNDEGYKQALVNMMTENYDANDADVVFQYIALGEVIYG